jgi:phenylacetate-CoA ligase
VSDPLWENLKGFDEELCWPVVSRGARASLLSLARLLDDSQWLAQQTILARQHEQLVRLAAYSARFCRAFRERLKAAGLEPSDLRDPANLARLPLLSRRDVQAGNMYCVQPPKAHLPVNETRTSGSTGEPVTVRRTAVTQLFWLAITLREYFWHERAFDLRLSAIRPTVADYAEAPDWGPPANLLFETGPAQLIPITMGIEKIAERLSAFAPDVLVIYPSVLAALIAHLERAGIGLPSVRFIRSISETLSPALKMRAQDFFGARVVDNYSSQEAGIVAVECPQSGLYHTMAENLIVEVIGDDGRPCADGETGRVVLTDLHNFATPLVRYDIGDYAQASGPCGCGRGLPALKRVLGRERNLILMPDGSRHWPLVGFSRFREVAPVVQYQMIQTSREEIEVRLVVETALSAKQQDDLSDVIRQALGHPFALRIVCFDGRLPAGPRGKFEEFVSQV